MRDNCSLPDEDSLPYSNHSAHPHNYSFVVVVPEVFAFLLKWIVLEPVRLIPDSVEFSQIAMDKSLIYCDWCVALEWSMDDAIQWKTIVLDGVTRMLNQPYWLDIISNWHTMCNRNPPNLDHSDHIEWSVHSSRLNAACQHLNECRRRWKWIWNSDDLINQGMYTVVWTFSH